MRKLLSPFGLFVFVTLCGVGTLLLTPKGLHSEIVAAPDVTYQWTAPTSGTPADHYVVQILVNDVDIMTIDPVNSQTIQLPVTYGNKYRVRVAAVDANGVQGPSSPWSIPYTPELAPPHF